VVIIGDLDGSRSKFENHLTAGGLVDKSGNWAGGNKKVVFQGDIVADRETSGLKILEEIKNLREQAQKAGGDIEVIVGNHDDLMISFLMQNKK
jgi:hypothetical protein